MERFSFAILLIFYFFRFSYSQGVYTTGIDVRLVDLRKVSISWRANTNIGDFVIYRNSIPISNVEVVRNSKKIMLSNVKSRRDKGSYVFYPYIDEVEPGSFFYLVLPHKQDIRNEDLHPLLNYTLSPIVVQEEIMTVKDFFIKTNLGSVSLFWSIETNYKPDNLFFTIYRTTNFMTNVEQLNFYLAYAILTNEFSFEDFNIDAQVPYYYTLLIKDFKVLRAGKNQNIEPVIFGSLGTNIPVEKEIRNKTNIKYQEFIGEFKRKK